LETNQEREEEKDQDEEDEEEYENQSLRIVSLRPHRLEGQVRFVRKSDILALRLNII
jgi:hypothetical protein